MAALEPDIVTPLQPVSQTDGTGLTTLVLAEFFKAQATDASY